MGTLTIILLDLMVLIPTLTIILLDLMVLIPTLTIILLDLMVLIPTLTIILLVLMVLISILMMNFQRGTRSYKSQPHPYTHLSNHTSKQFAVAFPVPPIPKLKKKSNRISMIMMWS